MTSLLNNMGAENGNDQSATMLASPDASSQCTRNKPFRAVLPATEGIGSASRILEHDKFKKFVCPASRRLRAFVLFLYTTGLPDW